MDFRLLGPIEVHDGEAVIDAGPAQQRALLALLLLDANRVVSGDRLVDGLWEERVPDSARKMLQVYVSRLRKLLGAERLRTHPGGYSIELGADELDVDRFQRLAGEGRAALAGGDAELAARRLREALALWRGPALAELDEPFARLERARLDELRLGALEERIEADLALGRHADLPAELESVVQRHPQRERLRAQHMLALYRCGRQAEALASYREGWRTLDAELGIQPGAELRLLEQRILRQDPELAAPRRSAATVPPSPHPRPQAVTRYASNEGFSLAYQVFGEGDLDLLLVTGWVLPMELAWDEPGYARFLERLGSRCRVLLWDKRGTGLSDRISPGELPSVEQRMTDLVAVMDAAGFERPAVFGVSEGSVLACALAARRPDRIRSLALYGGWARTIAAPDYPWGATPEQHERLLRLVREHWGEAARLLRYWAADSQDDPVLRGWWGRALRLGASPTAAVQWLRLMADFDVRALLPSIAAPSLVMHRAGDPIVPVGNGRYLGERIPGADYVELAGADHLWWLGDQDALLGPLERFLAGAAPAAEPRRLLATLLCAELETGEVAALRPELERHGGRPLDASGQRILASFDAPSRALRCAAALRDAAAARGLDLRVGLHSGECELVGEGLAGAAVEAAARVCACAEPGEILASRTLAELAAGSAPRFEPHGECELDGAVPMPLLALVD